MKALVSPVLKLTIESIISEMRGKLLSFQCSAIEPIWSQYRYRNGVFGQLHM